MENLDTNINPNIPESRDRIAAWVKAVGDRAESQGLEVKSSLEFSTRSERNKSYAKITKFILASANRDQKQAMRDYQGYGVMLIGVTQNEVCGLEDIPEQHNFEDATRGYFGSAIPVYHFIPHEFEDKNLLFVIVDPPVNGKEIYICSKEYRSQEKGGDQLRDGAIYCRESTQTIEANSVQMRGIINRLLGGNIEVDMGISRFPRIPRIDTEVLKDLYSQSMNEYAESLKKKINDERRLAESKSFNFKIPYYDIPGTRVSIEDRFNALQNYETRLEECFEGLLSVVLPPVLFSIMNNGTKGLKNPCIEYRFPGEVYLSELRDDGELMNSDIFPFLPRPSGVYAGYNFHPSLFPTNFEKISDSGVIKWKPGSINPGEKVTSFEDKVGIFMVGNNGDPVVRYSITDSNLQRPITGEINVDIGELKNISDLLSGIDSPKCK